MPAITNYKAIYTNKQKGLKVSKTDRHVSKTDRHDGWLVGLSIATMVNGHIGQWFNKTTLQQDICNSKVAFGLQRCR